MKDSVVRFVPDHPNGVSVLTIEAPNRPQVTRAIMRALTLSTARVMAIDDRPARHLLLRGVRMIEHDGSRLTQGRKAAICRTVANAIAHSMPAPREHRPASGWRWNADDGMRDGPEPRPVRAFRRYDRAG